jgi:hypothetical protein
VSDVEFTPADRELLAEYGVTMLHVQLFEFSLLGLVQAGAPEPEGDSFEAALKRLEDLFALTAGQLRRRAGVEDPELAGELEAAVNTRNSLAHRYLLDTRMNLAAGATTHEQERATLGDAARRFDAVRQRLDELTDAAYRERGIDPTPPAFTEEELRSIFRPEDDS